jgi:hypothetical protein
MSLPPPKLNPQRLTNPQSSGMTSRCGWRTPSVPIQIRASPCSIHGTANMCDILFLPFSSLIALPLRVDVMLVIFVCVARLIDARVRALGRIRTGLILVS